MHSEPFGCLTKLSTKRDKLVQKFVPRSRVGIFRNEHTRSTPLTLNSRFRVFLTIWVHYGPFCCLTKLGAKLTELVQKFVPRSCVGSFRNECTRSTPLDPKLMYSAFQTIWVHSEPFGCLTKLNTKRDKLLQKFVPRSRVGIFRNERTRSTPLTLNSRFQAFLTIWGH